VMAPRSRDNSPEPPVSNHSEAEQSDVELEVLDGAKGGARLRGAGPEAAPNHLREAADTLAHVNRLVTGYEFDVGLKAARDSDLPELMRCAQVEMDEILCCAKDPECAVRYLFTPPEIVSARVTLQKTTNVSLEALSTLFENAKIDLGSHSKSQIVHPDPLVKKLRSCIKTDEMLAHALTVSKRLKEIHLPTLYSFDRTSHPRRRTCIGIEEPCSGIVFLFEANVTLITPQGEKKGGTHKKWRVPGEEMPNVHADQGCGERPFKKACHPSHGSVTVKQANSRLKKRNREEKAKWRRQRRLLIKQTFGVNTDVPALAARTLIKSEMEIAERMCQAKSKAIVMGETLLARAILALQKLEEQQDEKITTLGRESKFLPISKLSNLTPKSRNDYLRVLESVEPYTQKWHGTEADPLPIVEYDADKLQHLAQEGSSRKAMQVEKSKLPRTSSKPIHCRAVDEDDRYINDNEFNPRTPRKADYTAPVDQIEQFGSILIYACFEDETQIALIDTGAKFSFITQRVFNELPDCIKARAFPIKRRFKGFHKGSVCNLAVPLDVTIGAGRNTVTVRQHQFCVVDTACHDYLLGMDMLGHFALGAVVDASAHAIEFPRYKTRAIDGTTTVVQAPFLTVGDACKAERYNIKPTIPVVADQRIVIPPREHRTAPVRILHALNPVPIPASAQTASFWPVQEHSAGTPGCLVEATGTVTSALEDTALIPLVNKGEDYIIIEPGHQLGELRLDLATTMDVTELIDCLKKPVDEKEDKANKEIFAALVVETEEGDFENVAAIMDAAREKMYQDPRRSNYKKFIDPTVKQLKKQTREAKVNNQIINPAVSDAVREILVNLHNNMEQWEEEPEPEIHSTHEILKQFSFKDTLMQKAMKRALMELIKHYADVFAKNKQDIGKVPQSIAGTGVRIETGDTEPIKLALRRIPQSKREWARLKIQEMLETGVIECCASPWAAPVVIVEKHDGDFRFCIDYRALNAKTSSDNFPIPRVDDLIMAFSDARWLSSADFLSGYWHIVMHEDSKDKTAFTCMFGQFRWTRVPFGLKAAPNIFQRLMETLLAGLLYIILVCYIDDVTVWSTTFPQHLLHLDLFFQRSRAANMKMKPSKCTFGRRDIEFLGHTISIHGLAPKPKNVEAIMEAEPPKNVKQVRRFLGATGYYRRFIERYSILAAPLNELTKKTVKFEWTTKCHEAWLLMRDKLASPPILIYPRFDQSLPFHITTDASDVGVGAVLEQEKDGEIHPISYASRGLTDTETRYSTIEKECVGVLYGLKQFRHMILGYPIKLFCDQQPLSHIFKSSAEPRSRTGGWLIQVSDYNIVNFAYKPGKCNELSDYLSRLPNATVSGLLVVPDDRMEYLAQRKIFNVQSERLLGGGSFIVQKFAKKGTEVERFSFGLEGSHDVFVSKCKAGGEDCNCASDEGVQCQSCKPTSMQKCVQHLFAVTDTDPKKHCFVCNDDWAHCHADVDWICCDYCDQWAHWKCISRRPLTDAKRAAPYLCLDCVKAGHKVGGETKAQKVRRLRAKRLQRLIPTVVEEKRAQRKRGKKARKAKKSKAAPNLDLGPLDLTGLEDQGPGVTSSSSGEDTDTQVGGGARRPHQLWQETRD
jgi:hypothetical protein